MTKYRVRDRVFDTPEAIADEFGVGRERVLRAFREGKQDTLGLPRGCKAVAVVIDDVEYPTISAGADETGIDATTIRQYLRKGRADELKNWSSIEVCGGKFHTLVQASKATGWHTTTLARHRRNGTLKDLKPKK